MPTHYPCPAETPPRRRRQRRGQRAGSGPPLCASAPPHAAQNPGRTSSGGADGSAGGRSDGRTCVAPLGECALTPARASLSPLRRDPTSFGSAPRCPDGSAAPRPHALRPGPSRGDCPSAHQAYWIDVGTEADSLNSGLGLRGQVPHAPVPVGHQPPSPCPTAFQPPLRWRGPIPINPRSGTTASFTHP